MNYTDIINNGQNEKHVIKEKIIDTYHTYKLKGKRNLKKTRWYRASAKEEYELTPQINEGITKVKWVKLFGISVG